MKFLQLSIAHVGGNQLVFLNDGEADSAYTKVKAAMEAYKPYSNDKGETVTIESSGGIATFRLEQLVSVHLEDASQAELASIEYGRMNRRIKEAVLGPAPAAA